MSTTTVVKIRRKNNTVIQGCEVYIGRACNQGGWHLPDSKWRNPYTVKACGGSAEVAVQKYEQYLTTQTHLLEMLPELKGKVLGCWCKIMGTEPCHGDVLARLANQLV